MQNTSYEPKKFDKITSVDNDTMRIDDPDLDEISVFSKTFHENTGLFGVLTMFQSSVSYVFHVILIFRERAKKVCLGKPCADREKERREKVL